MKSWLRDPESHVRVIDRVLELVDLPTARKSLLRGELRRYMNDRVERRRWLDPQITKLHSEWYRELYAVIGVRDPFAAVKTHSNRMADALIAPLGKRELREWIALSIFANRLDFGFFEFQPGGLPFELREAEEAAHAFESLQDLEPLIESLRKARRILYLPDNHGEIVFDRELIRAILAENPKCEIAIAGKAWPMLNDVTAKELIELGFADFTRVVSTGTNSFGVPLEEVSPEFLEIFEKSDVIIAKGQAYFEFWLGYSVSRLFNLLHTKITIVDPVLGEITPGRDLLTASERYAAGKTVYPQNPVS